jgi:hypothetical protein
VTSTGVHALSCSQQWCILHSSIRCCTAYYYCAKCALYYVVFTCKLMLLRQCLCTVTSQLPALHSTTCTMLTVCEHCAMLYTTTAANMTHTCCTDSGQRLCRSSATGRRNGSNGPRARPHSTCICCKDCTQAHTQHCG